MINLKIVELYCREDISKIENYDEAISDKTQTWCCHHRAEILPCGRYKATQLIKHDLYFNRAASELIFLTRAQHNKIHTLGRQVTDKTKLKISKANLGKPGPNLGKPVSVETRMKLSKALKGKPSVRKGAHLSKETKRKMSMSMKGRLAWNKGKHGRHWYNNGIICVVAKECPEGFARGRLKPKYLSDNASSSSK